MNAISCPYMEDGDGRQMLFHWVLKADVIFGTLRLSLDGRHFERHFEIFNELL